MAAINYLQTSDFDQWLADTPLGLVDFTASWCGPCKLVAPLMEQLADGYSGRAAIAKVDIDNDKPLAQRFGLKSIPAVLVFRAGELVETLVGVKSYEAYSQVLDQHL